MDKPYTSSDKIYANDLKIFIGKRIEIAEIERKDQIIDKKWYLAWDTGEFFVANSMRKLVRYGGSAKTLSKDEIAQLIKDLTKDNLEEIRSQLVSALKNYREIKSNFYFLEKKVDETLYKLETETADHIIQKINEILNSDKSFVYSKTEVDNKLIDSEEKLKDFVNQNTIQKETLNDYATHTEVNQALSKNILFDYGDNIQNKAQLGESGIFFAISNSSDYKFETGHTYHLLNGKASDITAAGGGGGSYQAPSIHLSVNGQTEIIKKIGFDFNDLTMFSYKISNPQLIISDLRFYENKKQIPNMLISKRSEGTFQYQTNLQNLDIGKYSYALCGEDKNGTTIDGTFNLNIIAPIYSGSTNQLHADINRIKASYEEVKVSPIGIYTFETIENDFLFIAIPSTMDIKKVTMNGFDVPMENPEIISMSFGQSSEYSVEYKYYRSSTRAKTGIWTVEVL